MENPAVLDHFISTDDFDVFTGIKVWCNHPDKVLSLLCKGLVNRRLFKIEISRTQFDQKVIDDTQSELAKHLGISFDEASYFVFSQAVENNAYDREDDKINILFKNGDLMDIAQASDNFNISALTRTVKKHFFCYYRLPG